MGRTLPGQLTHTPRGQGDIPSRERWATCGQFQGILRTPEAVWGGFLVKAGHVSTP